jgi:hypothetical protein
MGATGTVHVVAVGNQVLDCGLSSVGHVVAQWQGAVQPIVEQPQYSQIGQCCQGQVNASRQDITVQVQIGQSRQTTQ